MIRPIIKLGDEKLKQKSLPIQSFTPNLLNLIDDLIETMYAAKGIGIAAVQIGILKRIFVIDIAEITNGPLVFINPTITKQSRDFISYTEGCLSIPNVTYTVQRPQSIVIDYLDSQKNQKQLVAKDILAICIQHEYDHLEGKLFIDYANNKSEQKIIEEQIKQNNLPPYFT